MAVVIAKDEVREPLYAIVPLFNPWRHKSRYKHTERAIKHFMDSGAVVILIEAAFGRREPVFADSGLDGLPANCNIHGERRFTHKYIQVRTRDEMWLKENLVNVAAARALPHDWQQVCWLDSDIHFMRPNWVGECIQKLQHYKYLQMFSHAADLSPDYTILPESYPHAQGVSYLHAHVSGMLDEVVTQGKVISLKLSLTETPPPYPGNVWPGLAWAASREGWNGTGGLFDVAVWGGGDYDMAHALTEETARYIHQEVHPNYRLMLMEWQGKCHDNIRKNVGVMSGTVAHHWHGRKTSRLYVEKRQLMRKVNFDPIHFLRKDYQGVYQFHDDGSDRFVHFRDAMRAIAKARNEDSTEL